MTEIKFKDIIRLIVGTRFSVLDNKRYFLLNEKYETNKKCENNEWEKISKDELDIINESNVICLEDDFGHIIITVDLDYTQMIKKFNGDN